MSREFHELMEASFMHSALRDVEEERPITGEPVADAIREVLIELYPLEYAVASEQASDSGHERVVLVCHEQADNLERALSRLRSAVLFNKNLVETITTIHLREAR